MKIIKRKIIEGYDCKITFHKPITLGVEYDKKIKDYIVSHKESCNWGFGSTVREAIQRMADCIKYIYCRGHRILPSKSNQTFRERFNYLRDIIKKVDKI